LILFLSQVGQMEELLARVIVRQCAGAASLVYAASAAGASAQKAADEHRPIDVLSVVEACLVSGSF
jgi:hypothetical protein